LADPMCPVAARSTVILIADQPPTEPAAVDEER